MWLHYLVKTQKSICCRFNGAVMKINMQITQLTTDADCSLGGTVLPAFFCLSDCLSVLPHDIYKVKAPRITKLETEIFYH